VETAVTFVELARGLTDFLFSPPPFNLAGQPTPGVLARWPEGVSEEQKSLFLNLLAYSVSVDQIGAAPSARSEDAASSPEHLDSSTRSDDAAPSFSRQQVMAAVQAMPRSTFLQ